MAALGFAVVVLKMMLGKEKAARKQAEQDAQMKEAVIDLHSKTTKAVNEIQKEHREELIDVNEKLKTEDRNQLDNNW